MASLPAVFVESELAEGAVLVARAGSEAAGQGAGASASGLPAVPPHPGEGAEGAQVLPHGYTAADLPDKERE